MTPGGKSAVPQSTSSFCPVARNFEPGGTFDLTEMEAGDRPHANRTPPREAFVGLDATPRTGRGWPRRQVAERDQSVPDKGRWLDGTPAAEVAAPEFP